MASINSLQHVPVEIFERIQSEFSSMFSHFPQSPLPDSQAPRSQLFADVAVKVSPVSEMSQLMASALSEVKSQLQDDLRQLVQEEMASLRRNGHAMADAVMMWNTS